MKIDNVLCVDGWSSGNPGLGGYKITNLQGKPLDERNAATIHTNNYYELYGVYKAVKYAVLNKLSPVTIYTDSATVLYWISSGKHSATKDAVGVTMMIKSIRDDMKEHAGISILKWDTARRGQIPADPGRK